MRASLKNSLVYFQIAKYFSCGRAKYSLASYQKKILVKDLNVLDNLLDNFVSLFGESYSKVVKKVKRTRMNDFGMKRIIPFVQDIMFQNLLETLLPQIF